ncbi:hypothetical protein RN001_008738 [Aquatica leii]|uniref:THAP-type domain-containing protein n=1 Tax=Aquatica leii TaxID=1421715 RepID=A0AAN7SH18_9COLE|nr:hypothetical protein RN001_008738 [Aquatica leii]
MPCVDSVVVYNSVHPVHRAKQRQSIEKQRPCLREHHTRSARNVFRKMSYLKCNYPGCSNKVRQRTVRFYKFPTKRKSVCDQWILACENKQLFEYHVSQLQNMAICELHFKEEDFKNASHDRLLPNAVPIVCKEENNAVEVTYIHNNRLHTEENREVRVINNSSGQPNKKTTSLRVQECTFPLIVTKPIRTLNFKEEDFKNASHDRLLPNAVPIICKEENNAVEVTYIHNNRLHTEENRKVRVINNSSGQPNKKTTSLRVQECNVPLIVTKPIRTYENTRRVKPKLELDQDPLQAPVRDPPQEKTQPVLPFLLKNDTPPKLCACFITVNDLKTKLKNKKLELRRMVRREKRLKIKLASNSVQNRLNKMFVKLPVSARTFINMQLLRRERECWTETEKNIALDIFHKSPSCYFYLKDKLQLRLPALSTIKRWINVLKNKETTL